MYNITPTNFCFTHEDDSHPDDVSVNIRHLQEQLLISAHTTPTLASSGAVGLFRAPSADVFNCMRSQATSLTVIFHSINFSFTPSRAVALSVNKDIR